LIEGLSPLLLSFRRMDEKAASRAVNVMLLQNLIGLEAQEAAMEHDSTTQLDTCIGIDLGDRYCQVAVLDRATGEIQEESRIPTTQRAFRRRFENLPPARIAIEVGGQSPWVSRLLNEAGHEVLVANSRKLRLIYENDSKSDRVDAEYLARLAAADPKLLHPIQHRGLKTQQHRAILVARDQAVACRTKLINSIRGMAKAVGKRLPSSSTRAFHKNMRSEIPEGLAPAIVPMLDILEAIQQKIYELEKLIETLEKEEYPQTARLRQVAGVGPVIAMNYVLTIEDPTHFPNSRAVGSFVGLRPKQKSSGGGDPELRISKAGDKMLRRHLVQGAQYILGAFGPDTDLRRWGLKLAARGGKNAKKRATVAVARKLAVLLHRLWISGEEYEPLRNSKAHAE